MYGFRDLAAHIKKYGRQHQLLYWLALMILFWSAFDGMTTYITPLIIIETGISKSLMGLIIGSSSIFGGIFDFLMYRLFKHSHFRQIFMLMFGACFMYLGILFAAKSVGLFLLAMALWGVYYDLKNFGSFDFVAGQIKSEEHASSFGVLQVFQSLGYLLAPIVAGLLITQIVGKWPFVMALIFLVISGLFLFRLILASKKLNKAEIVKEYKYRGVIQEIKLWLRIDKVLLPVLVMMAMLSMVDSFFWTIGPLLAESFKEFHPLAGFFMTAFTLPHLLVGWMVGRVSAKLGKKRTGYLALLIGCLFLSLVKWINHLLLLIGDVFAASFFIAFSWPSIQASFADYVKETKRYEKEIESLEDLYINLGFVIGPILAGLLADNFGNQATFSFLGLAGMAVAVVLMKVTPREINVLQGMRAQVAEEKTMG